MSAVAGRDRRAVAERCARLGWESTETDWQALVDARRHRPGRHLHAR